VDSISSFTAILQRYHLLDSPRIAEAAGPLAKRFLTPKDLAGELIRRSWLTPFQVNQIFQGRGGDLLFESYVLLERLGEGGMGQVFKARNWKLDRLVALKVIRKDRLHNADAVRRFHREVRAAAQLNHANVVHAYDCGEAGERHFYVMEYVDGIDLAQLVRRNGPLPAEQACECGRQAALGLQHAYERGLVHRDIKPHNLLLARCSDGKTLIKILDMGLARLEDGSDSLDSGTMTREGIVMGTLDYIAPEQARNAHLADTRADLYSLGCTLYFLLAGQPPFHGSTPTEKLLKHQIDEAAPIASLRPDVPASLAAVLERLMAKRPEHRYQTPVETASALAAVAFGQPSLRVGRVYDPCQHRRAGGEDATRSSDPIVEARTPLASAGQTLNETIANWSSIVEAPAAPSGDGVRRPRRNRGRRREAQSPYVLWWGVAGSVVLLALIGLLLYLL
jgi:serine/threonine protein kinase